MTSIDCQAWAALNEECGAAVSSSALETFEKCRRQYLCLRFYAAVKQLLQLKLIGRNNIGQR
jgi:hypothetical protein